MNYKFRITTQDRKDGLKKAFLQVFHFSATNFRKGRTTYKVYIDPTDVAEINIGDKVIGSFQHWEDGNTVVVIKKFCSRENE